MVLKEYLTSEHVKKRFVSSFDLVKYAIRLARNMIQSDRATRVDTPIQNKAYQLLLEISEGKDELVPLPQHTHTESATAVSGPNLDEMLKQSMERKQGL